MVTPPEFLLSRLDAIGASLARSGSALALLGLGSVGLELDRLDRYSDLDFFVIVESGHKREYLDSLGWLAAVHPVVWSFRNTPDGHKILFADGIFGEFAVFEAAELGDIPFAPGRLVWKRDGVPEAVSLPRRALPDGGQPPVEWSLGEALSNLYVGLCRFRRGEKLAAMRLIQGHAVDRLLELAERLDAGEPEVSRDPFARERRVEARHPRLAAALPAFAQGYEGSVESARALAGLAERCAVPAAMRQAIEELCDRG